MFFSIIEDQNGVNRKCFLQLRLDMQLICFAVSLEIKLVSTAKALDDTIAQQSTAQGQERLTRATDSFYFQKGKKCCKVCSHRIPTDPFLKLPGKHFIHSAFLHLSQSRKQNEFDVLPFIHLHAYTGHWFTAACLYFRCKECIQRMRRQNIVPEEEYKLLTSAKLWLISLVSGIWIWINLIV